jgi:hypothetical protein
MPRSRSRLAWLCLLAIFAGAVAPRAFSQNWTQPARELAAKIVGHVQSRSAMSLTVQNVSSMDAADVTEARRAVESQLRALGVRLVSSEQAVEDVDVTFSESSGSYLWVAQIGRSDPRDVVMVTAPMPPVTPYRSSLGTLRRMPLVSEPVPILDIAPVTGTPALLVLDAEGIKLYRSNAGRWALDSARAIVAARPLPRDLRGRIIVQDATLTVFVPGTQCSGQWTPLLSVTCRASDDPWPLPVAGGAPARAFFNASRDFFAGPLSPPLGTNPAPFYSAARLALADNSAAWLFAGTDGTLRLVNSTGQPMANFAGWGSDLAAASNTCGGAPYVVAAGASAPDQPDTVRAYQLSGRKMTQLSEPLEFPGPVTALWTQPDGAAVLAVSKNLKTGDYEASNVALTCGR